MWQISYPPPLRMGQGRGSVYNDMKTLLMAVAVAMALVESQSHSQVDGAGDSDEDEDKDSPFCSASPEIISVKVCHRRTDRQIL